MSNSYAAETPLPRRARDARKARGWTQQDVADRAGVTLRTYQSFESGTAHPQPANLAAFTDVLGLNDPAEGDDEPRWSPDTTMFLNMLGLYMEELSDKARWRFIETETRRIFQHARGEAEGAAAEVDPAVYAEMRRVGLLRKSQPQTPATGPDRQDA